MSFEAYTFDNKGYMIEFKKDQMPV